MGVWFNITHCTKKNSPIYILLQKYSPKNSFHETINKLLSAFFGPKINTENYKFRRKIIFCNLLFSFLCFTYLCVNIND